MRRREREREREGEGFKNWSSNLILAIGEAAEGGEGELNMHVKQGRKGKGGALCILN